MKTLRVLPLQACALLCCSCTGYLHEARSVAGNYERDILVKVGGTASLKGADGSSAVTDDQASFNDGVTGLGAYGAAKVAGNTATSTNASNNSLAAAREAEQTQRLKNASDATSGDLATTTHAAGASTLAAALKKGPPQPSSP